MGEEEPRRESRQTSLLSLRLRPAMSSNPRISVMTFNIWGNEYLSERTNNLDTLFVTLQPDILLLQEVTPENLQLVRGSLPNYESIQNNEAWCTDCSIFWRSSLFEMIEFGFVSFELPDYPRRGLYWIRMALLNSHDQFIVATAHFPWVGCQEELLTGVNQRIKCATLLLTSLHSIKKPGEPIIFGGDLNDDYHPLRILQGAGQGISLCDVFELLDLPPQITHPVRPSDAREEMRVF
jgi:endonuclease/exonuclease/phosphatase family metal-dependent hydrolase